MKWVFCFYTRSPRLSYTILQANHHLHFTYKLKQNRNFPTSFNLYTKGRLKRRIELILLCRQAVLFGEGAQRALQHGNRAVNQTATAASGQQLAQALQGAEVV